MKEFEGHRPELELLTENDLQAFGTLTPQEHAEWYFHSWLEFGFEREGIGIEVRGEEAYTHSYAFNEDELRKDFEGWWDGWSESIPDKLASNMKEEVFTIVVSKLLEAQGGKRNNIQM